MENLTALEKRILIGAVGDLKKLPSGKPASDKTKYVFQLREQIEDAKHGYVRLDVRRWIGQELNGAGRMAAHAHHCSIRETRLG